VAAGVAAEAAAGGADDDGVAALLRELGVEAPSPAPSVDLDATVLVGDGGEEDGGHDGGGGGGGGGTGGDLDATGVLDVSRAAGGRQAGPRPRPPPFAAGLPAAPALIRSCGKLALLVALMRRLLGGGPARASDGGNGGGADAPRSAAAPYPHRVLLFSQSKRMLDIFEALLSALWEPTLDGALAEAAAAAGGGGDGGSSGSDGGVQPRRGGVPFVRIDGDVAVDDRRDIVAHFNASASTPVCLLTTGVGSLGLTLTGADRVVVFDPSWNPAVDSQAVDRAYRLGQTRDVVTYRCVGWRYRVREELCCGGIVSIAYRLRMHPHSHLPSRIPLPCIVSHPTHRRSMVACGTVEERQYGRQVFKGGLTTAGMGAGAAGRAALAAAAAAAGVAGGATVGGGWSAAPSRLMSLSELRQLFKLGNTASSDTAATLETLLAHAPPPPMPTPAIAAHVAELYPPPATAQRAAAVSGSASAYAAATTTPPLWRLVAGVSHHDALFGLSVERDAEAAPPEQGSSGALLRPTLRIAKGGSGRPARTGAPTPARARPSILDAPATPAEAEAGVPVDLRSPARAVVNDLTAPSPGRGSTPAGSGDGYAGGIVDLTAEPMQDGEVEEGEEGEARAPAVSPVAHALSALAIARAPTPPSAARDRQGSAGDDAGAPTSPSSPDAPAGASDSPMLLHGAATHGDGGDVEGKGGSGDEEEEDAAMASAAQPPLDDVDGVMGRLSLSPVFAPSGRPSRASLRFPRRISWMPSPAPPADEAGAGGDADGDEGGGTRSDDSGEESREWAGLPLLPPRMSAPSPAAPAAPVPVAGTPPGDVTVAWPAPASPAASGAGSTDDGAWMAVRSPFAAASPVGGDGGGGGHWRSPLVPRRKKGLSMGPAEAAALAAEMAVEMAAAGGEDAAARARPALARCAPRSCRRCGRQRLWVSCCEL
jgi:hypothetical protein